MNSETRTPEGSGESDCYRADVTDLHMIASDVIVYAGVHWYGTPATSSIPDERGLRDFTLGVHAFLQAIEKHAIIPKLKGQNQ